MNREILFKAKRLVNGKWVEGLPGYDIDGNITELEAYKSFCNCQIHVIDPETLCQYTGLTDKNGKKIWENDILNCGMKLRVSWHTFKASWVLSKKGWMYNHFFGESVEPEDVEVIGNIFDNADLLEVE